MSILAPRSRPKEKPGVAEAADGCQLAKLTEDQQHLVRVYCDTVSRQEGARWICKQFHLKLSEEALDKWMRKERQGKAQPGALRKIREDRDRAELIARAMGAALELGEANTGLIAQAVFEQLSKAAAERDVKALMSYILFALKLSNPEPRREGGRRRGMKRARATVVEETHGSELEKMRRASVLMFGEPIKVVHEEAPKSEACG